MFEYRTFKWMRSLLTICCLSLPICFAQHHNVHVRGTSPQSSGSILPPGTIDGSANPELIPDVIAYRIFLSAACQQPNSPIDEKARQAAMLSQARLSPAELVAAVSILANYQQQMSALEQAYNAAVAAKSNAAIRSGFAAQRDAIVTATKGALAGSLSGPAMARFDQLIQSEKRRMKLMPFPAMP